MESLALVSDMTPFYRPSQTIITAPEFRLDLLPPFGMSHAELMAKDSQVALGTIVRRAMFYKSRFEIYSKDAAVAKHVAETLQRIWRTSLRHIVKGLWFRFCPGEVFYRPTEDGTQLIFDHLKPFRPSDCVILQTGGKMTGIRVRSGGNGETGISGAAPTGDHPLGVAGQSASNGQFGENTVTLRLGKMFGWLHDRSFSGWQGRSVYEGAYRPWWDKCSRDGALESRRLWNYKCAFSGGVIRHPSGNYAHPTIPGLMVPYQDMARQIGELYKNGAVYYLPSDFDKAGRPLWSIEPPTVNGSGDALQSWVDANDIEILRGMEIPDDVIQQVAGTGSWSGRSIPAYAFINSSNVSLNDMIAAIDEQIIHYSVGLNFGPGKYYEIRKAEIDPNAMGGEGEQQGEGGPNVEGNPENGSQNPQEGRNPAASKGVEQQYRKQASGGASMSISRFFEMDAEGPKEECYIVSRADVVGAGYVSPAVMERWSIDGIDFGTLHAPPGGIRIAGKYFEGGEFIPADTARRLPVHRLKELVRKEDEKKPRIKKTKGVKKSESEKTKTGLRASKAEYDGKVQFTFKNDQGKEIGEISLVPVDGGFEVSNVLVWPEHQRQGHGTSFYRHAWEYAKNQGKKLFRSDDRTDDAIALHKTFPMKGREIAFDGPKEEPAKPREKKPKRPSEPLGPVKPEKLPELSKATEKQKEAMRAFHEAHPEIAKKFSAGSVRAFRLWGTAKAVAAHESAKIVSERLGGEVSVGDILRNLPAAHQVRKEEWERVESLKKAARKLTGLNSGNISMLEEMGIDHSKVPRFDEAAASFVEEHPESGFGNHEDPAAALWEFLKEGSLEEPKISDEATEELAAEMSRNSQPERESGEMEGEGSGFDPEDDSFDFTKFALQFSCLQDSEVLGGLWFATLHAPKGGITISGKKFAGGQFIPPNYARKLPAHRLKELQRREDYEPTDEEHAEGGTKPKAKAKEKRPAKQKPEPEPEPEPEKPAGPHEGHFDSGIKSVRDYRAKVLRAELEKRLNLSGVDPDDLENRIQQTALHLYGAGSIGLLLTHALIPESLSTAEKRDARDKIATALKDAIDSARNEVSKHSSVPLPRRNDSDRSEMTYEENARRNEEFQAKWKEEKRAARDQATKNAEAFFKKHGGKFPENADPLEHDSETWAAIVNRHIDQQLDEDSAFIAKHMQRMKDAEDTPGYDALLTKIRRSKATKSRLTEIRIRLNLGESEVDSDPVRALQSLSWSIESKVRARDARKESDGSSQYVLSHTDTHPGYADNEVTDRKKQHAAAVERDVVHNGGRRATDQQIEEYRWSSWMPEEIKKKRLKPKETLEDHSRYVDGEHFKHHSLMIRHFENRRAPEEVKWRRAVDKAIESHSDTVKLKHDEMMGYVAERSKIREARILAGRSSTDKAELDRLRAREDQLTSMVNATREAKEAAAKVQRQKIIESLFPEPAGGGVKTDIEDGPRSDDMAKKLAEATEFINRIVSPKFGEVAVKVRAPRPEHGYHDGRAYALNDGIHLVEYDAVQTIVHEIGHVLDSSNGNLMGPINKAYAMRAVKASGEKMQSIEGCEPHEIGAKANLYCEYSGKFYPHESSEILSRGVELLYADPVKFYQTAPDHFMHVVSVLRGDFL